MSWVCCICNVESDEAVFCKDCYPMMKGINRLKSISPDLMLDFFRKKAEEAFRGQNVLIEVMNVQTNDEHKSSNTEGEAGMADNPEGDDEVRT